jgi:hypothetical protein
MRWPNLENRVLKGNVKDVGPEEKWRDGGTQDAQDYVAEHVEELIIHH